jgi:hypothetical protein
VQVISTLKYGIIEEIFFKELILLLKSREYNDYNSARHELSVYQKYKRSGYEITKQPEDDSPKPDFIINLESNSLYIECKSIIPEVIKLTPRLSSFRERILAKLKRNNCNGLINIILDSNKPDDYETEVEELINSALKEGQNIILHGKNSMLQFSIIKVSMSNDKLEIIIPTGANNVGGIEMEFIDNNVFAYGINFLPFLPNDYKKALSNQLSKASKQIESNGEGIVHIQFPELRASDFIDLIANHGHRIQHFLNTHPILAIVLEIPNIVISVDGVSHVFPNIEIVYFKSTQSFLNFANDKPYWLEKYQKIDSEPKSECVVLEFEINKSSKSFILYLCDSELKMNIKVYIIDNKILLESIINDQFNVSLGIIPSRLIQENNKLAFNIGQNDNVFINGKKIMLK